MAIILPDLKKVPCEECGMFSNDHRLLRISAYLDSFSRTISRPIEKMIQVILPAFDKTIDRLASPIASFLVSSGMAIKITDPDKHSWETAQALWEEAKKRGIDMYEIRIFGLPRRHFIARYKNSSIAFEAIPRPARRQRSILWIDDKSEVKRRLGKAGFPVPRGQKVLSEKEAVTVFNCLQKPVVVKPREGSGGRHTTVKVKKLDDLIAAYRNVRVIAPSAIVEEELHGPVYRATLIDKKLAAILRRDPPQVTGDGRSTIKELVKRENENPLRRGPVFAKINVDSSTLKRELARQNLQPDNIPRKGQVVYFNFKVNWGVGGTSRDATDEAHPENRSMLEEIGKYLGDDVVGVDFMIEDISKPWRKTKSCGIIECNSLPVIGNHHFPYTGPVVNVAGKIWDMVFPETKKAPA